MFSSGNSCMRTLSPKEALNSRVECNVEGGTKATTVRFHDPAIFEEGKERAKELGTSFSSYVSSLVSVDVKTDVLLRALVEELNEYYKPNVHTMSAIAETMAMDFETIYALMADRIGLRFIDATRENKKILKQKLEELGNGSP